MPRAKTKVDPIRVLIVDDHPVVRAGLAAMIDRRADMEVVGQAESGEEALKVFRAKRPDVTLMDLRLRGMGGVAAIAAIRADFPDARIVVVTTYGGDDDIQRAIKAGAMGYLLKYMRKEELLETIRAAHRGERRLPPAVATALADHMAGASLSPREREVLQLIAAGKTNQEIAATLHIVEGTVKVHITKIFAKLGVHERAQAVSAALRRGIVHLEHPPEEG